MSRLPPITALTALPAPSGGAVRLIVHSRVERVSCLILATVAPEAPDPLEPIEPRPIHVPEVLMPVRLVHAGALRQTARYLIRHGKHAWLVMDLDSDALVDDQEVHYHLYPEENGVYGAPISVTVTPRCARSTAATLGRDAVKARLRYHLRRACDDRLLPYDHVPILEQEVREEGAVIPAILVKETATPNPSAEAVGHGSEETMHPDGSVTREYRFAYRTRVDILAISDNPSDRRTFEAFLRGVFPADLEFYQASGIEEPSFSYFPNHTVTPDGTDEYSVEVTFEGTVYTRVMEETMPLRDNTTLHRP